MKYQLANHGWPIADRLIPVGTILDFSKPDDNTRLAGGPPLNAVAMDQQCADVMFNAYPGHRHLIQRAFSGVSQGIQSKNNRDVGVRTGKGSRAVNPAGASQIGYAYGEHATNKRSGSGYRGERLYGGDGMNPVKYGNEVALNVKGGGPGKGYVQYGQCGTQGQYGKPVQGDVAAKQPKDILSQFGPDYIRKGRFGVKANS
jgi:hypothetical protein